MTKSQVEQTLEDLNVDVEKVKTMYKNNSQKIIPKEWYFSIIFMCIKNCDIKPDNINHNKHDRVVTVVCNSKKEAELFESSFHANVLTSINKYIQFINKNPKHYNRALILETIQEGISFTINY